MKKIGLVGGTGPESTLMYYKELNLRIDSMTGGKEMPDVAIESVNFRKAWDHVSSGNYSELIDYLSEKVSLLKGSGCDIIALTAGTMHIVFDEIEKQTGVSLVSIPKAVCDEAVRRNYKKVGLLGTVFTMEKDYMKKDLINAGIEVFVPCKDDRELIAKRILEELELGIVKDSTLQEFNAIIEKMRVENGIEAVILGCTELPLLLNDENSALPCLDSVDIHIRELIRLATNDKRFVLNKYTYEDDNMNEIWEKIYKAYIYSFPLMIMDATMRACTNTAEPDCPGKAPANRWMHAKELANASFRQVVTPNVDTIYSQVFLDLSKDALVLHKPAVSRYVMFQIMDAWSDTVAVLGTGGDTDDEQTYLLTGPDFCGEVPSGMTQVRIPTGIAWLLGRVICYGPDDMGNVYKLQEEMDVKPLSVWKSGGELPKGKYDPDNDGIPIRMVFSMGPEEYFDRANKLMISNPPYAEDAPILKEIAEVGVGPGSAFDPGILGKDAAENWKNMIAGLAKELTGKNAKFMVQNKSFRFFGDPISRFGTEYEYRCLIAIGGFGANPVDVAVYMKSGTDDTGAALNGRNRYVMHIEAGEMPPFKEKGFWSITAYGDDDFLIDNPINRYSVSNRTALEKNEDRSVDIYIQKDEPEKHRANWLPVSEEGFHLFLRIYRPDDSVLDGSWTAPSIVIR